MDPTQRDHSKPYHWQDITTVESRVRALESLLIEKGIATSQAVDAVVATFENDLGPMNGAQVVARSWTDKAFRDRLLEDGTAAISEMGFRGLQTEHVKALENSDQEHHLVVCTLCSCYPWTLLGIPPHWFKAPQYRSRAVINPREVLQEFGVTLKPNVRVRVWDTSAELRYLVIPQRPRGTDGWAADKLAKLVTRDSMIGVGLALDPKSVAG